MWEGRGGPFPLLLADGAFAPTQTSREVAEALGVVRSHAALELRWLGRSRERLALAERLVEGAGEPVHARLGEDVIRHELQQVARDEPR